MTNSKTITFTLRLLKKNKSVKDALKANKKLDKFSWPNIPGGELYIGNIFTSAPTWLSYLAERINNLPELVNQGSAAILFIPVQRRKMVLCFGQAQFALNIDAFERNFGLRVALNKIKRSNIRSLDTATPDAVTIQRRIQASQNMDIGDFGVDYERDLISLAAGTPSDSDFARFIAGKDSLRVTCTLASTQIKEKCKEIYTAYESEEYKKEFAWVDYIQPVRNNELVSKLDEIIHEELKSLIKDDESELHLSPPEIINYLDGTEVKYTGFGSRDKTFPQLNIEDYVSELTRCKFTGNFDDIKTKHKIAVVSEDDDYSDKWKIYDSFVLETEYAENKYVIFSGNWYEVDKNFAEEIERFFKNIQRVNTIKETDQRTEPDLIEYLKNNRSDLLILDQEKINPEGTIRAYLEPCDFFSDKKQFIHIKNGHSSGPISHLWMQGVVSAESFLSDEKFRKELKSIVKTKNGKFAKYLPDSKIRPQTSDYQVIFSIMRKPYKSGDVGLPFFSKVSLRNAVKRLEALGYRTALNLILKKSPESGSNEDKND